MSRRPAPPAAARGADLPIAASGLHAAPALTGCPGTAYLEAKAYPFRHVSFIAVPIAILAVAAAIAAHTRIRSRIGTGGLSDEQVREIERSGRIELDEPLDREAIRAAEKRFWEEIWDESEE